MADTLSLPADSVVATGGVGESTATRNGGDGGEGRIRIDFNELNGFMSTARASETQANSACEPDAGYLAAP